jgi:hypothetical protein
LDPVCAEPSAWLASRAELVRPVLVEPRSAVGLVVADGRPVSNPVPSLADGDAAVDGPAVTAAGVEGVPQTLQ